MKKVYITSLHMGHGGVEMAITLLANALVKRSYEVEIICIYHLGNPVYKLDPGVKITYLTDVRPNRDEFKAAIRNKNIFKILKEGLYACKVLYLKKHSMQKALRNIKEGTVISTRIEHSVLLSKYGNPKVNKIAQLHHDHNFDDQICDNFKNRFGNIDHFVVLTDLLKDEISEMMKENKHTVVEVIPNFLTEYPKESTCPVKRQVVAVGRLHEVKGFDRLIDIWAKVNHLEGDVLKIIGDGDEKDKLEARIRELGLSDSVILTGALPHDKVMEEMQTSLAYVMTSHSEAFPFVLLEAMSAGLPVVAFDVRVGPRAIVHHEKDGYLVEDGNEAEFAKRLESLMMDETLRRQMSDVAHSTALQFSEDEVLKKWTQII